MEAQQMATTKLSDEEFWAFLEKYPDLRDRFASIVSAVENSEGNLKEADTAEERILEAMRHLGREAMQGWAEGVSQGGGQVRRAAPRGDAAFGAGGDAGVGGEAVEVTEQEIRQQPQMHRQGKK